MHKSLLFTLLASTLTAQRELWVDPANGSNANAGTYDQPLQTLTSALALATAGDRIHLLPGLYGPTHNGEPLPISIGLQSQPGIVIRGIGDVVFDLAGSSTTVFQLLSGASGARITNITIQNTDQAGWWTRAINSGGGVNAGNAALGVEIDRCRFLNTNRAFVLWTSDNVTGWQVHDNLFVNSSNDAILEYSGTNDFYNNTFYTGAYKAYISDSITSRCHNNLVVGYSIGFECNNSSSPLSRFQGNWLYQCATSLSGAGMSGTFPSSNVIGVNPLLTNPGAGDYHVQPNSPTIDAGVQGTLARADLDGNSRIVDGLGSGQLRTDVGCYETTPFHLTVNLDQQTRLMWIDATSTVPGAYGFVLFSFDDGLVSIPGQGPILLDPVSFIGYLSGPLPNQWIVDFNNYVAPPGQRFVMQVLGLRPNAAGSPLGGGNQVWTQL